MAHSRIDRGRKQLQPTSNLPVPVDVITKGHVWFVTHLNTRPMQAKQAERREVARLIKASPPGAAVPSHLQDRFEVRAAEEHGGGKGAWTVCNAISGGNVGVYGGRFVPPEYTLSKYQAKYAMSVDTDSGCQGLVLAHDPKLSSWIRYINRPNSGESANVGVFTARNTSRLRRGFGAAWVVILYTLRDIAAGEQLLLDYEL
jgi:hypothetical protein